MHTLTLSLLLGFSAGVIIGERGMFGTELALVSLLLGVTELGLASLATKGYFFRNEGRKTRVSTPLIVGVFFITLALGIIRMQFITEKETLLCHEVCTFSGTIMTTPEHHDTYQTFVMRPHEDSETYDVLVKTALYPEYGRGEALEVTGRATLPKTMMEHGDARTFDYRTYLHLHGIGSEMLYPKVVREESAPSSLSFTTTLVRVRDYFVSSIERYVSPPASSLASGMLFGNVSLSQDVVDAFRIAGLSHIIVLSGFNIAVLIGFVLLVLRFVPLGVRIITAGIFVTLFVIMVGGGVSVIRATIMAFIALTALLVGRAYTAHQALLLSLFVIIAYEPSSLLHDVSLHLSFLATAGIVYGSVSLKERLTRIGSITYREIIATTLCAYGATLPYIMYTFGTVSVYALVANLLILPLLPTVMAMTFLLTLVAPVSGTLASLVGYGVTQVCDGVIALAEWIATFPFASLSVHVSFLSMCSLYLVMAGLMFFFMRQRNNETIETKQDSIFSEVMSF